MSEKKYQIQDIQPVAPSELLGRVRQLKDNGYRLAQVCGTPKEDGAELLYTFDKDHILLNLRVRVKDGEEVESITGICPLCDKDTTQYLYWIIKNVRDVD